VDRITRNRSASAILPNIEDVWRRLGGDDLKRGRARAFWRDGHNSSAVSVDIARNIWRDHVSGAGGGILDLVRVALNVDKAGALRWLESEGLIEPRQTTRAERAEYAARRRRADDLAARVVPWWRSRERELEKTKAACLDREDFDGLETAATLLFRLQTGGAAAITEQWIAESRTHPRETADLEREGRVDLVHCELVTAAIVGVIARAGGVPSVT